MAEEDKGWGQGRAVIVVVDQVIAQEVPVQVCVVLNFLKCETKAKKKSKNKKNVNNTESRKNTTYADTKKYQSIKQRTYFHQKVNTHRDTISFAVVLDMTSLLQVLDIGQPYFSHR